MESSLALSWEIPVIACPFYSFQHLSVSQIEDAYSGLMYGDDTTLVFHEPTTERLEVTFYVS